MTQQEVEIIKRWLALSVNALLWLGCVILAFLIAFDTTKSWWLRVGAPLAVIALGLPWKKEKTDVA